MILLFCQPRVEVTSCFVDKVMGLTLHDRINKQLIYRIAVAQVVTRRITKPQRTFFRFESHWLLFFIHFFLFIFFGGGRGVEVGFYFSLHVLFIFLFISFYYYFLFFIFIPSTYIKTSVATQATVNYEIHANVSVKRHICDVKICD